MFQLSTTRSQALRLLALPLVLASASAAYAQCDYLQFDGVDDICTILDQNHDFDLSDAMTLEAWVNVAVEHNGSSFISGQAGNGLSWRLGTSLGDGKDALFGVSVPNTDSVKANDSIFAGTWQHFAGTYDGTDMKLYVNGVHAATWTHGTGGPGEGVDQIVLGQFATFHEGAMDELRIWNVVRTDAEIGATYATALVGDEPGLVGYYKFDEGAGDDILDSSLKGNHGNLGGAVGPDAADPVRVPGGPLGCGGPIGTNYCGPAALNSTGQPGVISAFGNDAVANNDVRLDASQLALNQNSYFITSMTQGFVMPPASQGFLCLGGTIGRFNANVLNTGGAGEVSLQIDLTNIPIGAGVAVQPGETWNFQLWYRDVNPMATSNFTDGLSILFQ